MKFLLSIIIPTRDRYNYLKPLILFLINHFPQNKVEIIIQDNTEDNNPILDFINSVKNRVFYYHSKLHLCLRDNADLAVLHAHGDYILFLGDDDCIVPNLLSLIENEIHHADAFVFPRVTYVWPDALNVTYLKTDLYLPKYTKSRIIIDLHEELNKVLASGGQNMFRLPKLYHGVVSRKILDKVYEDFGTYFPGASPDMGNAIALTLYDIKTMYIDYPAIIAGTGGKRIAGNEKGDWQDLGKCSFLPNNIDKAWCTCIPPIWSTPTIYAQTVVQVLKEKNDNRLQNFSWKRFAQALCAKRIKSICTIKNQFNTADLVEIVIGAIINKIKNIIYNRWSFINYLRGYKKYRFDKTSAENYAKSVYEQLK